VGVADLSDVANVTQTDGQVLASDGTDLSTEGISAVLQDHAQHSDLNGIGPNDHHAQDHDHTSADVSTVPNAGLVNDSVTVAGRSVSLGGQTGVLAEDLSNVIAQNRSDGDTLVYDDPATQYIHLSISDLIKEYSDTGIFNDVLVGGVVVIRSDTEPTVAEWETELGRTLSNNEVPENVIWVDSSTSPSTTLAYDPEATSGYQQASYARSGYWIEYATGLLDAGLFTDGDIEADDIIAEGSITGNEIKSETTITIGTNTKLKLDGINDRIYSTDFAGGTDGFEIDLKDSESQLPNLDVVGTLDADTWDQSLSEHTDASVSSASDSDVLAHDGTQFVNEGIAALLTDHAQIQDLGNVPAPSTDGQVIADQGGTYANEAISSLTESHVTLSDLDKVGINNKSDGHVLVETGGGWGNEAISGVLGDHADWSAMQNVAVGSAENREVAFYDTSTSPSQWSPEHVADIIRDRGSLSIGDVSVAGSWRTIESATEPTQRPNGDPLKDGDVWIDTDASPVAEAYVYRNGSFIKQATAIGGNNIVTDSVSADKVVAGTLTAQQIKAGTLTATEINTSDLFADSAAIDTLTSEQAFIDDIENITFTGQSATIERLLEVGTGTPTIQIDGTTNRIESTNFASLTSGFRIQSDGFAEFGNIRARGAIRSAVFERDEQVLRGGTDIVTPSTTLAQDASSGDTTIEVQDVPFSAGDDIRFREAGTAEVRTISSISGTTLTLNSSLNNNWTSGAAIARTGAERIINSADSQFAPFSAYLDDQGQEQVRIGNLEGVSGRSGYGIQVGGGALFYDSVDELLRVKGDVFAERGKIGPFSLNNRGFSGEGTNLNATGQSLGFFDTQNGSDLTGNYTNPDFSSGDLTGWTEKFDVDVFNDGSDNVVRPNDLTVRDGNPDRYTYSGKVSQTADLSAFSGETVTFSFYFKKIADTGGKSITLIITDKNTGNDIVLDQVTTSGFGDQVPTPVKRQVELPSNASSIEVAVVVGNTGYGSAPPQEPHFNKLEVFNGSLLATYSASEMALFDTSGNKNLTLDAGTGNINSKGKIEADERVGLGGPASNNPTAGINLKQKVTTTADGPSFSGNDSVNVYDTSGFRVGQLIKVNHSGDTGWYIISSIDAGNSQLFIKSTLNERVSDGESVVGYALQMIMENNEKFLFNLLDKI
jgi:hypothetical protein